MMVEIALTRERSCEKNIWLDYVRVFEGRYEVFWPVPGGCSD